MTVPVDPELVEAAAAAARLGGEELARRFGGARRIDTKASSIDLVTDADRASEEKVVGFLRARFPRHAVLAEERGSSAGSEEVRWIIDPLDGTTNYAHKVPHFSVSVGAQDAEGLAAGAIFDPLRGELFVGGRGRGATLNGEAIRVSPVASLEASLLATGFPYDVWTAPELPLALMEAFLLRTQGIRRGGSAALDMAYVACGRYDGFFEARLKAWDIAAGAVILSEAGGRATNLGGEALTVERGEILASNGLLHEAMASLAREIRASAQKPPPAAGSRGAGAARSRKRPSRRRDPAPGAASPERRSPSSGPEARGARSTDRQAHDSDGISAAGLESPELPAAPVNRPRRTPLPARSLPPASVAGALPGR